MVKLAYLPLPLSIALALTACGGSDSPGASSLVIPFAAKAGDVDIACGAHLTGLGRTGDGGTINDFAFYIHDITLLLKNGSKANATLESNDFQDAANGVALLDFQNKTDSCNGADKPTNAEVSLTVNNIDTADINGIEFKIGIPSAVNHHDASTSQAPYNRSGMFWNWQFGHKFMRMDVNPDNKVQLAYDVNGSVVANTFFFHLGSTGCEGDPAVTGETVSCANINIPQISLKAGFTVGGMTTSTVLFDYAKLMRGVNLNTDSIAPSGCMSGLDDIECQRVFSNLGMEHAGTPAAGAQKTFSIVN